MGPRMGRLKGNRATRAARKIELLTVADSRSDESDRFSSLDTDDDQELVVNENAIADE